MSSRNLQNLDLQLASAPNSNVFYCNCTQPTLLAVGIGKKNRLYLNCARKDPSKDFTGGCDFYAWLDVYIKKHKLEKKPMILCVLPSVWYNFEIAGFMNPTFTLSDSSPNTSPLKTSQSMSSSSQQDPFPTHPLSPFRTAQKTPSIKLESMPLINPASKFRSEMKRLVRMIDQSLQDKQDDVAELLATLKVVRRVVASITGEMEAMA